METEAELVRCVACRREYELTADEGQVGCPGCGAVSWVSTRIADDDADVDDVT